MAKFNFNMSATELSTFSSMFNEAIDLTGEEYYYVLAENVDRDIILGEHNHQKYLEENTYQIQAKMEEREEFTGDKIYSEFGIEIQNNYNFFVSKKTFETIPREPQENDLIIPKSNFDKIYEVTRVGLEAGEISQTAIYNLNDFVGYKLVTHIYSPDNDIIETNIEKVDNLNTKQQELEDGNENINNIYDAIIDNTESSPWEF